jgi:hypothetical protein
MLLYVNGDSHTAAAEAVNPHAFAEDDGFYWGLGRQPHPDNLRASYGCELANHLDAVLECGAESASSNDRILRTSREWLMHNHADLVVIQWSTWEREEWLHNGTYYQVNASGIDHVPAELQEKYRQYVIGVDWLAKTQEAHEKIWEFHQELVSKNIPHVFFNGNNDFSKITNQRNWGANYIRPYDPGSTFDSIIRANGFKTVCPESWHFGPDSHCFWANYMLQYITDNQFIQRVL